MRIPAICLAMIFIALSAVAQDVAKVAPKNVNVLLDNAEVRVLEVTTAKGETIGMHSHPPYIVYALSAGKTHFVLPDGKTKDLDLKVGETIWSNGGAHAQESVTDNHLIVIELKHGKPVVPAVQKKK